DVATVAESDLAPALLKASFRLRGGHDAIAIGGRDPADGGDCTHRGVKSRLSHWFSLARPPSIGYGEPEPSVHSGCSRGARHLGIEHIEMDPIVERPLQSGVVM